jgi:hypothetical protein
MNIDIDNKQFDFEHYGEAWRIKRTRHLYEKRKETQKYSRDEFLDKKRYIEIFKEAIRNGLTSFRNKGVVVVTIPDYAGKWNSLLCTIDNKKNLITVITVFVERYEWWKTFVKTRNRINILNGYIIPKMTEKEKNHKKFDRATEELVTTKDMDYNYFKNAMNDVERLA